MNRSPDVARTVAQAHGQLCRHAVTFQDSAHLLAKPKGNHTGLCKARHLQTRWTRWFEVTSRPFATTCPGEGERLVKSNVHGVKLKRFENGAASTNKVEHEGFARLCPLMGNGEPRWSYLGGRIAGENRNVHVRLQPHISNKALILCSHLATRLANAPAQVRRANACRAGPAPPARPPSPACGCSTASLPMALSDLSWRTNEPMIPKRESRGARNADESHGSYVGPAPTPLRVEGAHCL